MTLLAGAYARRAADSVSDGLCNSIERALSRHPGERPQQFRDERCFLVKADIHAFGGKAFRIEPEPRSFQVSQPSAQDGGSTWRSRSEGLCGLHGGLLPDDVGPLGSARGVFGLAHYQRHSATLILLTDKLGIRPIYY